MFQMYMRVRKRAEGVWVSGKLFSRDLDKKIAHIARFPIIQIHKKIVVLTKSIICDILPVQYIYIHLLLYFEGLSII